MRDARDAAVIMLVVAILNTHVPNLLRLTLRGHEITREIDLIFLALHSYLLPLNIELCAQYHLDFHLLTEILVHQTRILRMFLS